MYLKLHQLAQNNESHVLVTIIRVNGSSPRNIASKMIVLRDSIIGSIGGGHLEFKAMELSRELIDTRNQACFTREFTLGAKLGQCCGGSVEIMFEPIIGSSSSLAVFGAGHIGKELVLLMKDLQNKIVWIDSREDQFFKENFSNVEKRLSDGAETEVDDLPARSKVIILTHDHGLDFEILKRCLKADLAYIGLIGSQTKWKTFTKRLLNQGFSQDQVDRVDCPAGIKFNDKRPKAVAIALAAKLLLQDSQNEKNSAQDI
ncbi:MAG: xanthine dehydrogenase accessory protein XdhC [Candidatus Cloacimonetes bacterium]|nr:xanthine dehydrogenase accessory protein XdhC [Candidatus Cloacimonadota bacterium]